jgi:L-alanine-DL-glutamate epimerase-like enolase superfamily enzyme
MHLLASQPHGTYVEVFTPSRDPIWWNILRNRPEVIDGQLHLTAAPGFGLDIDPDFVARYRVNA